MTPTPHSPIGLIDSGMGGISIWTALVRAMPAEDIVYWADTAHCPYGGRERDDIIRLVSRGVETLQAYGVKIIVLACNTATTAAISALRAQWPAILFVGLEPAVKPAARQSRSHVIGVLGTAYTVQSAMFRETSARYAADVRVIPVAGEGLVELVEAGLETSPETTALLRRYIEPLLAAGADELVLACTHFPLLEKQILAIIGDRKMEILDPAPAIARHTRELLEAHHLLRTPGDPPQTPESRQYTFLSTGSGDDLERLERRALEHSQRQTKELR